MVTEALERAMEKVDDFVAEATVAGHCPHRVTDAMRMG